MFVSARAMRNKRWHIRRALVADPRTDPMIANSQGRTVRLVLAPALALALALALAVSALAVSALAVLNPTLPSGKPLPYR